MLRLVTALLFASTVAHADPVEVHTTAAGELTFGEAESALGFRGQFLLGTSIKSKTEYRPTFAIGPTVGAGAMQLGMTGNTQWSNYHNVGVAAQAGLRFVTGGYIDDRIYASLAILHVTVDHPTIQNQSERSVGVRGAFGFTFADAAARASKDHDHIFVALPHAWEFVVENDGGATRVGFTIGYGI